MDNFTRFVQVSASEEEGGTFTVRVDGQGFTKAQLAQFILMVENLQDENTALTLPVIEDLNIGDDEGDEAWKRFVAAVSGSDDLLEKEIGRAYAISSPDIITTSSESEAPPAGYRTHQAEDGSRVFVRIPSK